MDEARGERVATSLTQELDAEVVEQLQVAQGRAAAQQLQGIYIQLGAAICTDKHHANYDKHALSNITRFHFQHLPCKCDATTLQ
jgi:hypothetical protein